MKRLVAIFLFLFSLSSFAQTSVPGGNVSGTWTLAGSPYLIQGTITIPNGQTLAIDPGVTVNFQGHYKFNVQGRLLALGTVSDTIVFTAVNTVNGWHGIRFFNTPATNDTSKIKYCTLQYGKATGGGTDNQGGALFFQNSTGIKAIISNCRISNCVAEYGGGIYCGGPGPGATNPIISNNVITYNTVTDPNWGGGGIYCSGASPRIADNVIANCTGGAVLCLTNSDPFITGNDINNNTSGDGSGIYCSGSNPIITNNDIHHNSASGQGGGICLKNNSNAFISQNSIANNISSGFGFGGGGGGGIYWNYGAPIVEYNVICNNEATISSGGGICIAINSQGTVSNNIICNNTTSATATSGEGGGGIACLGSSNPTLTNNTIANNNAVLGGGLFFANTCSPDIRNTIIYGNTASNSGAQAYLIDDASDPNFYHCDVQGGVAAFGLNGHSYTGIYLNNIDFDPKFVAPSTGSGTGFNGVTADWSLQSSSPCIDGGDPSGTYPASDIAGNLRVRVCRIDIGAHEYNTGVPLSASINQAQQILCNGDATSLTANVSGGAPTDIYSYAWTNGSTTQSVSGVLAGIHTVTVSTNISLCKVISSYTVTQPPLIVVISTKKDDNACNAINDGWAKMNVSGGVSPYSFQWSIGNTVDSIGGLAPGNYTAIITDNIGCVISRTVTIGAIGSLSITLTPNLTSMPDTCSGNVGAVFSSPSGGMGSYTFAWSNGSSSQNIVALPSGNYTVTVEDSLGCAVTNTISVGVFINAFTISFSSISATCHNADGSLTANPAGGANPYSYAWSNSTSAQTANNLLAGNYTVNVTDKNGCTAANSSLVGTSSVIVTPAICMVTVDSVSKNNVILWDKTSYGLIDSFIVYREVGVNNYQRIGAVPYDSLSLFVDTVRTKYFPNTGDPNAGTYRYKLGMKDSCGNISVNSPYHNTIYIINSSGAFSWTQHYTIESAANPVISYILMRDDLSNGNWHAINSVSGTQQNIIDPNYLIYQSTGSWRVETQWAISCNPTIKDPQVLGYNTSRSNIYSLVNGVHEYYNNPMISIYPNPSSGQFVIYGLQSGVNSLDIYDVYGKCVFQTTLDSKSQVVNPLLSSGMYLYKISDKHTIIGTGKLVIQ